MKNIFLVLSFLLSVSLFSQTTTETIHSTKLDTDREITIKLPASYTTNLEKKYPLILVLDSEYLFSPFEGNLAYGTYWEDMPEVILVGINQNKNHERDSDSEFDEESGLPIKKGGAFFEFIGAELLPYLDKKYRIAPFKVVAGLDSTAGLINAFLYKEASQFNGYISLSPELAAGMETRVAERLAAIKEPLFYYHATSDGDLKRFQKEIKILDKNITAVKNPMLKYKFDDFKNASHYSLVLHAIPSALYQIFAVYQPISTVEYQEKIAILPNEHAAYLVDKYNTIEKWFGIKMKVRLNDFKAIEAAILKSGDFKGFEELAQISGQQYEKTMLFDYHMGMYYEKTNNLKRAILSYQNAFTKEEIGDLTKNMMLEKSEDLKKLIPVKPKGLKGGKAKEIIEETPATETPVETPTETPTEEKKP
ncbi:alpha/beta hydrolase [Flavobacterium sp.]|uniref:alpha/beta hydrolase n=1 Tax=Flavobacterium sp. TaxID=239 RepID=UPI00374D0315